MSSENSSPEDSSGSSAQMQSQETQDGQDMNLSDASEFADSRKGFTIHSWNINGIRSLNMKDVLNQLNSDIVIVQETKISRNQLDSDTAFISDYTSFFSFCRSKSGYSGVASYCGKQFTPRDANEGLINDEMDLNDLVVVPEASEDGKSLYNVDAEGRCVITEHIVEKPDGERVPLAIFNLYCPRLRCDPEDSIDNTDKKLLFHDLVLKRALTFVNSGGFVIIAGDFNISHKPLDHVEGAEGLRSSMFCGKMDELLQNNFHDTFRSLHPDRQNAFTCWNSKTNARQNNYGTRLDYIVADDKLMKYLESAEIHPDVKGSDHCPVSARFHSLVPVPSPKIPAFATKFYPELTGTQKKIHDFFIKAPKSISKPSLAPTKKTKSRQLNMAHFILKKPKLDSAPADSDVITDKTNKTDDIQRNFKTCTSDSGPTSNFVSIQAPAPTRDKSGTDFWKQLMKPPEIPRCTGHDEPCARKTVKKKGPTNGRQFWACPRGAGSRTDPNANCGFFKWCS